MFKWAAWVRLPPALAGEDATCMRVDVLPGFAHRTCLVCYKRDRASCSIALRSWRLRRAQARVIVHARARIVCGACTHAEAAISFRIAARDASAATCAVLREAIDAAMPQTLGGSVRRAVALRVAAYLA